MALNGFLGRQVQVTETAARPGSRATGPLTVGVLVAVLAAGAAIASIWASGERIDPTRLSRVLPAETCVYAEIPSIESALAALSQAKHLKRPPRQPADWLEGLTSAIADSFGIDREAAKSILQTAHGVGLGAMGPPEMPELALLFQPKLSQPLDALLASPRFVRRGNLGRHGLRYALLARKSPPGRLDPATSSATLVLDAARTTPRVEVGYWRNSQLLAFGSPAMLQRLASVQDGKRASLEGVVRFRRALDTAPSDSLLLGWADGEFLNRFIPFPAVFRAAFAKEGVLLTARAGKAGVSLALAGSFEGKDASTTPLLFESTQLRFPADVPAGTLAYVAVSTKTNLDGNRIEHEAFAALGRAHPEVTRDLNAASARFLELTGISFAETLGSLGNEFVIGIMEPAGTPLRPIRLEALERGALFLAIDLDDVEVAKRLLAYLSDELLVPGVAQTMNQDESGFLARLPLYEGATLQSRLLETRFVITLGALDATNQVLSAFAGLGRTLGHDDAHTRAVGSLPQPTGGLLWLDTGRLAAELFARPPAVFSFGAPLSMDPFELTGPNRVTSAIALSLNRHQKSWQFQLQATNLDTALAVLADAAHQSSPAWIEAIAPTAN